MSWAEERAVGHVTRLHGTCRDGNGTWCNVHQSYWPRAQEWCREFTDWVDAVERVFEEQEGLVLQLAAICRLMEQEGHMTPIASRKITQVVEERTGRST